MVNHELQTSNYKQNKKAISRRYAWHTSWISSGLVNNAAPMPPLIENDLGQPIFISTAATSLHLKEKYWVSNSVKIAGGKNQVFHQSEG